MKERLKSAGILLAASLVTGLFMGVIFWVIGTGSGTIWEAIGAGMAIFGIVGVCGFLIAVTTDICEDCMWGFACSIPISAGVIYGIIGVFEPDIIITSNSVKWFISAVVAYALNVYAWKNGIKQQYEKKKLQEKYDKMFK